MSSASRTFYLAHDQAKAGAKRAIDDPMYAGWKMRLTPPAKSRDQEEKYHAMIGEIADQFLFCGRLWSAEDMKRLLIDQFKRDTINDPELKELWASMGNTDMAPSLDRSGVIVLGTQSRKFPKELAIAFIEWLYAFGAQNDVGFTQ